MSEANKSVIRRMFEGFNQHNLPIIGELYRDCVYYSPITGELRGEAHRKFLSSILTAFPDGRWTVEEMLADGDKVVCRWSFTGTHAGMLMGIPSTGRRVRVTGIVIDRVVDGKILEEWEEWDALGMMRQLGVVQDVNVAEAVVA